MFGQKMVYIQCYLSNYIVFIFVVLNSMKSSVTEPQDEKSAENGNTITDHNKECFLDPGCNDKINTPMACGYDNKNKLYKMFNSKCHMDLIIKCENIEYIETPVLYCVKYLLGQKSLRRAHGDSCPVFCPQHYRPVCGASKLRDYLYRTFTNGCYLDMLNCRGEDEYTGYVEVPLSFCQRHSMKNIWKESVMFMNT